MRIDTLLIANRGEIACRIIRTARRMGIRCVAIHSDADRDALHVKSADESHWIGPSPASESYLVAERILEVAERCGAQAVHPGYGFLSENAAFAEACAEKGVLFVGPPARAIRQMAEKHVAKSLMEQAGVPVVPGDAGESQHDEDLARAADHLGYPLLIKAVAGGGGRGMRVVEASSAFGSALDSARREAMASFGDSRVLLERLIVPARHIEVQVFADQHGNALHLFERDCSIQRRHQKVIEEAPAPGLSPRLRAAMGDAAVRAIKAIDYRGVGTVEFLLEPSDGENGATFYFMEMNTRLQVEHSVTELVTGVDLVEWQIREAMGERVPLEQDALTLRGHSIEARVYAEDPAADFLPAAGRIAFLAEPESSDHLRVETGFEAGDVVSSHYDSMLAKLVVWGEDRDVAIGRMRAALGDYRIAGIETNVALLERILAQPDFERGGLDTGFLDRHLEELVPASGPASDRVLGLAALEVMLARKARSEERARTSHDPTSPWSAVDGWRLGGSRPDELHFASGGAEQSVAVMPLGPDRFCVTIRGRTLEGSGETTLWSERHDPTVEVHHFEAELLGQRSEVLAVDHAGELSLFVDGEVHRIAVRGLRDLAAEDEVGTHFVVTPMPGRITQLLVVPGEAVEKGQLLLVLEAMKMEHRVKAPIDAVVESIEVAEGEQVEEGTRLLFFATENSPPEPSLRKPD